MAETEKRKKQKYEYNKKWMENPENRRKKLEYMREWKRKNKDKVSEHQKRWYEKLGKEGRDYQRERAKQRHRQSTEQIRKRKRERDRIYAQKVKDTVEAKARTVFRSAVRGGKIKRGPCEVCGKPDGQGHHDDYSKPLEVKWLCRKHHSILHRKYT